MIEEGERDGASGAPGEGPELFDLDPAFDLDVFAPAGPEAVPSAGTGFADAVPASAPARAAAPPPPVAREGRAPAPPDPERSTPPPPRQPTGKRTATRPQAPPPDARGTRAIEPRPVPAAALHTLIERWAGPTWPGARSLRRSAGRALVRRQRLLVAASSMLLVLAVATLATVVWTVERPPVVTSAPPPESADAHAAAAADSAAVPPEVADSGRSPAPRGGTGVSTGRPVGTTGDSRAATRAARRPAVRVQAPPVPRKEPQPEPPPRLADGTLAGWLRVDAPATLRVSIDGRAIGTTEAGRLLVPAGTHRVELESPRVEYRSVEAVTIEPGAELTLRVALPFGELTVHAPPDVEVLVDGEALGRAPLLNVPLAVGVHEVVLRHPEHGDRRYEAVVREGRRTSVSVDLPGR